jgi:VanZ family protein
VLHFVLRGAGWTCVVALIVLSVAPGNERPHTGVFPGQIEHVIAYCGTAGILGLGYPTAGERLGMVVMLAFLAAALEVVQLGIPGRHSQFIDFAASSAGACLGMSVAALLGRVLPIPFALRSVGGG